MFIVTGGAGFIGSNLAARLIASGANRVVVVDDLSNGKKCLNLADLEISDYLDKDDFLQALAGDRFGTQIKAIFHQGACSRTDEWDGRFVMRNNFEYTKNLFHYCQQNSIPFIYASSASVYGCGNQFSEQSCNEHPLNPYGFSKLMFDRYLRSLPPHPGSLATGLRYFNVYGPREQHKEGMASVAFHFDRQLREDGRIRLFEGSGGFADGEQRRDFIHVDDIVSVNIWAFETSGEPRILNVGTGVSRSFNDVARQVIDYEASEGRIEYIAFPDRLKGAYQHETQADLTQLRKAGYSKDFLSIEAGVARYLKVLRAP